MCAGGVQPTRSYALLRKKIAILLWLGRTRVHGGASGCCATLLRNSPPVPDNRCSWLQNLLKKRTGGRAGSACSSCTTVPPRARRLEPTPEALRPEQHSGRAYSLLLTGCRP